jgi:xeroderma pigmentosum group C-complementing protein
MGMRILERVREEYGEGVDDTVDVLNPWTNKKSKGKNVDKIEEEMQRRIMDQYDEDMAGGFLPEGHNDEEPAQSFFPTRHDDDDDDDDDGGGFIVEGEKPANRQPRGEAAYATPISLLSNKHARLDTSSEEEEQEEEEAAQSSRKKPEIPTSGRGKNAQIQRKKPTSSGKAKPKTRTSNSKGKLKQPLPSSDDDDDDEEQASEEESSLSSLASAPQEASPPPLAPKRRVTQPKSQPRQRAVSKRKAARKSETALKSHYFMHGDDEGDNDE